MKFLLALFLITSCASTQNGSPREGKTTYAYVDEGGSFKLVRETKTISKKIVTRSQIIDSRGSANRVLEKAISVSQVGSIKSKKTRIVTVRPFASEFVVWLEGKKYSSTMKLNTRNKSMTVKLESPEERWSGVTEVPFPQGKYFCFYSQIPECIYHNYLLKNANENRNRKFEFYVIWDGYPFIQEQLVRVGKKLFAPATIKFDGAINKLFRYIVEVEGQVILYQFTKSSDLVKVAWISQGITIAPPGEEVAQDDE